MVIFVPDLVYPESAQVGNATAPAVGHVNTSGIATNKPSKREEIERKLVDLLRSFANQSSTFDFERNAHRTRRLKV